MNWKKKEKKNFFQKTYIIHVPHGPNDFYSDDEPLIFTSVFALN